MNYSAHIFIGGIKDHHSIKVPSDLDRIMTYDSQSGIHDEYRRELIGAPGKTWSVFVHSELTIQQAMELLILNYQHPPPATLLPSCG